MVVFAFGEKGGECIGVENRASSILSDRWKSSMLKKKKKKKKNPEAGMAECSQLLMMRQILGCLQTFLHLFSSIMFFSK